MLTPHHRGEVYAKSNCPAVCLDYRTAPDTAPARPYVCWFLLSYASAVVYFVLHNLVATAACMKMTIHGMVRSTALRVLLSLTFQCNRSDVPSGAQVQQECCCPHARTQTARTHPAEIARDGYSISH